MVKKSSAINLLSQSSGNYVDRFVNWALSIGRVVVILTEVIALSAFLYRFSLDRQLIDLHSKIKQEQAVVTYLKENEDTYRNLQNRILLSTTLSKTGADKVDTLKDIISFTPLGVSFNNITIQEDRVRIEVFAASAAPLSDLVKEFKNYSKISNVIVEKIENRPSSASINMSITAMFKK